LHHHSSPTTEQYPQHRPKKTAGLAPCGNKSGIMVSVILVLEAFEHVAKNPFLIMERLLGIYTFCLVSPW